MALGRVILDELYTYMASLIHSIYTVLPQITAALIQMSGLV